MKRILCLALLVVVAIGAPTFAATKSNKSSDTGGEIGFGVGQSDVSDDTSVNSAQFIGVRGGYHLNNQWQVEGQFATSSASDAGTNVDTKLFMVNGVMNFHPRKKDLVPYVMAGIGRADISVDPSAGPSASDNSVAYQVGGGTRVFFGKTKTMAFRADLSLLRDTAFSSSSTLTTVTAGITWKLGGH